MISMKNCNDTIGNRTSGLPACSAVPQPTAPPRVPHLQNTTWYNTLNYRLAFLRFSARFAALTHVILTEILCGFPQSLQTWYHESVSVRLLTSSYKSFLTYDSLIFPHLTINCKVCNTDSVAKGTLNVFEMRIYEVRGKRGVEKTSQW
jgi:hypothetical protein